jgi:tetratricopeptide (TPR) repeat protein
MSRLEDDEARLDALLDVAARDLAVDGSPHAGDEALLARGIDATIARALASQARDVARRKRGTYGAVAAAVVVASASFALIEGARSERQTSEPHRTAVATAPRASTEITATAPPESTRAAEASQAPPLNGTPPSLEPTAAQLFAQANEARRRGDEALALRQYGALQRRFPRAPEASLSHVALARLYLDRLGDPAHALAEFDQYLAGSREGALDEETLVGRALALQRLGRAAEEKDAWQKLLAVFPNSLSTGRARARLLELH